MVNALVPSDKPVCGSLKPPPYPHDLGLFLLNCQIWNKTLSPSVVSVRVATHSANVSIAYCLPTLTPPSGSVADFVMSWMLCLGTGALPPLSPWPGVICLENSVSPSLC
jgi:hypothetical protein